MIGPFTHNIDPVIVSIGGVHLWFYGLSFTLGFLNAHLFIRRNRERLGLSMAAVYDLPLLFAAGVLIGGRALVVLNNEREFYRSHLDLIPAIWVGGFASRTHLRRSRGGRSILPDLQSPDTIPTRRAGDLGLHYSWFRPNRKFYRRADLRQANRFSVGSSVSEC
jgi:hypothetical protein